MREINVNEISKQIKEMCISINYVLSPDMQNAIKLAHKNENNALGANILGIIEQNLQIASQDKIPICQDTGMAVVFMDIGQDVHLTGGDIDAAVNEGVRAGYREGYLRKSVVSDPLIRNNTGDNTPAVIHYSIVPGENIKITLAPKGFGSENMSKVCMLKPADGEQGVLEQIVNAVKEAGPNACPPVVVGVGIGGTFEKCAILAKKALTRPVGTSNEHLHIAKLEQEALKRINELDIGPAGLGGNITALAVNIETYPTHIAGLPVGINICCHVNRHITVMI